MENKFGGLVLFTTFELQNNPVINVYLSNNFYLK